MSYRRKQGFVSESTWSKLDTATLELVLAVTLLVGSASLVAMSLGEPETMALVAVTGIAVILLGLAVASLFEHVGTRRTPNIA